VKIAFIHPFFLRYPRGIERYTANLASALTRANAEVDILTWKYSPPLVWKELDPRVRVIAVPAPRYYTASFAWYFYLLHLKQERYQHVFIHFADYGEARALSLFKKQTFSIVLHFPYSQVHYRYHTLTENHLFERADHIVAVSDFVRREMNAYSGRESVVIPHGVDTDLFQPSSAARDKIRQSLGLQPDAPLILSVCALEMRKGVQHVMHALPTIIQNVPKVQYVVMGDGPDAASLHRLCQQLGLVNRVHFLPASTEVQSFYQSADVFAIPAKGEASSLASLEALACALPVVASCRPPFAELIQPDCGYLVNEENSVELAGILVNLLQDGKKRESMGMAGRKYVLEHHVWDRIAARYLELISN
jgi:glycosyltransferase involved in cell wall biosynthesis